MTTLHVVVPEGIDDPNTASGGNRYDRRLIDGLRSTGRSVTESAIAGMWPIADVNSRAALGRCLDAIATGGVVVIDGLIASAAPDELARHSARLRIVTLIHLPRGVAEPDADEVKVDERAALVASVAVVATSAWTRGWLVDTYRVPSDRVHVARPGAEPAAAAEPSVSGTRLLGVGTIVRHKGQDVLVEALGQLRALDWTCHLVGSLTREGWFADALQARTRALGIHDRLHFDGVRTGEQLDAMYRSADLVVVPSRIETYGMVVSEAVAHGLPVVASNVGGVSEALAGRRKGRPPGLLVAPADPSALAGALRAWLRDDALRGELRARAAERRDALPGWDVTVGRFARVLDEVAA